MLTVWGYLEIKLVEDGFIFVHFAKLSFQIISHIEGSHRTKIVPNIPNVDRDIVSRDQVVLIGWVKASL